MCGNVLLVGYYPVVRSNVIKGEFQGLLESVKMVKWFPQYPSMVEADSLLIIDATLHKPTNAISVLPLFMDEESMLEKVPLGRASHIKLAGCWLMKPGMKDTSRKLWNSNFPSGLVELCM